MVILPEAVTFALKVSTASPFTAIERILFEVKMFVPDKVKSVEFTNVRPVGKISFACTFVATSVPAFLMVMV